MWRRKFRKVWPLKECKLCATVHSSANLKLNISKSGQLWSSGEAVLPAGTNPSDWLIFSQCWDKRIDQDIFIVLYYRPSLGLLTQKETFFLNRFLFVYLYSFLCIQLILTKLYNCVTLGLSLSYLMISSSWAWAFSPAGPQSPEQDGSWPGPSQSLSFSLQWGHRSRECGSLLSSREESLTRGEVITSLNININILLLSALFSVLPWYPLMLIDLNISYYISHHPNILPAGQQVLVSEFPPCYYRGNIALSRRRHSTRDSTSRWGPVPAHRAGSAPTPATRLSPPLSTSWSRTRGQKRRRVLILRLKRFSNSLPSLH